MTMADLDSFADKVLDAGEELQSDHPGFHDVEYRQRRKEIVDKAKLFRWGDKIERIEYTASEKATWQTVYRRLKALHPTHACREFNAVFPLLEKFCGYSEDNIPQLQGLVCFEPLLVLPVPLGPIFSLTSQPSSLKFLQGTVSIRSPFTLLLLWFIPTSPLSSFAVIDAPDSSCSGLSIPLCLFAPLEHFYVFLTPRHL
jgi:hypothetical protein